MACHQAWVQPRIHDLEEETQLQLFTDLHMHTMLLVCMCVLSKQICNRNKINFKYIQMVCLQRDGEMAQQLKSMHCSSRGPKFHSHHLHWAPNPLSLQLQRIPLSSSGFRGYLNSHACTFHTEIHTQAHIKNKINLKEDIKYKGSLKYNYALVLTDRQGL